MQEGRVSPRSSDWLDGGRTGEGALNMREKLSPRGCGAFLLKETAVARRDHTTPLGHTTQANSKRAGASLETCSRRTSYLEKYR